MHYRRDLFLAGLAQCGFTVDRPPKSKPDASDVLLVWNRHGFNDEFAKRYEAAGARVIVAENGYVGTDDRGHQLYAMAIGHHLGAGKWHEGQEDRWTPLNVPMRPWRKTGREIIVLPQRGIGPAPIAMAKDWPEDVVSRLKSVTDRPIRVRLHPGKSRTDPWPDLQNAWAAVTWASGSGIKSILCGVPVFCEMPSWIGLPAARLGIQSLEDPFLGDRLPMLRRLAWAQFSMAEIASGSAFQALLK